MALEVSAPSPANPRGRLEPDRQRGPVPLGAAEAFSALAGFSLLAALFYAPILLHARVYTFRDLYPLFISMDHLARVFGAWHWPPLWNPLEGLGRPFAADLQAGVFYPPNWCFRRLPEPFGFNLSIWFHHVVAAWGAFLLLRWRALPAVPATLGAAVFAFGGFFASLDCLINGLQSATWLPWIALAYDRWCDRQSGARLVATALATALCIMGGLPEFALIAALLMGALAIDRQLSGRGPDVRRAVKGLALVHVLALGLCVGALVQFVGYVSLSTRHAGLGTDEVLKYSLEPLGALSLVLPRRFLLADGSLHLLPGILERAISRIPFILTLYIGAAVAVLAGVPAALSRPRRRWWAGVLFGFMVLAWGGHVPGVHALVDAFPALRIARYPEKFLLGVHALASAGIAIGLSAAMQSRQRFRAVAGAAAALAAAAAIAAAAVSWWGYPLASPVMQVDLIRQALLFTAMGAAALLAQSRGGRAAPLLLICAVVDLFSVNAGLLPTASWEEARAVPEALDLMRDTPPPVRIFADEAGQPRLSRFPQLSLQHRDLLLFQSPSLFLVANLNTPAPLNLGDRERIVALIRRAPADRFSRLLGAFNVSYLTSPQPAEYPGLTLVQEPSAAQQPWVYRVADAMPRAFVPHRIRPVRSDEDAIEHLLGCDNPATEVAVPEDGVPPGLPLEQAGQVGLTVYRPDRIELHAEMATPGLVVLADAFYPGWKATVDGAAAPIVRVNGFVRGVFLRAGSHPVTFEYQPFGYRLALSVSFSFALVMLAISLWHRRHR